MAGRGPPRRPPPRQYPRAPPPRGRQPGPPPDDRRYDDHYDDGYDDHYDDYDGHPDDYDHPVDDPYYDDDPHYDDRGYDRGPPRRRDPYYDRGPPPPRRHYDDRRAPGYGRGPPRPPSRHPPKKKSSAGKIIAVVIVLIVIMALVFTYFTYWSKLKVGFEETDVDYYLDPETGALTDVMVKGQIVNNGFDDIPATELWFECNAEFLIEPFKEQVLFNLLDDEETIRSGDKVFFEAFLGGTKSTTYSTKGNFIVTFEGVENDHIVVDVSKYYR